MSARNIGCNDITNIAESRLKIDTLAQSKNVILHLDEFNGEDEELEDAVRLCEVYTEVYRARDGPTDRIFPNAFGLHMMSC